MGPFVLTFIPFKMTIIYDVGVFKGYGCNSTCVLQYLRVNAFLPVIYLLTQNGCLLINAYSMKKEVNLPR